MTLIYDCFLFYDEFTLLDIRLAELGDLVDKFVLLESNVTFSGKPKPLHFSDNMQKYSAWKDKIIPIVCQIDKPDPDRWVNESNQRNAIGDYLKSACNEDDLIILTDADEIVSKEAVIEAKGKTIPGRLIMKMYYYYFNCLKDEAWQWPCFCRYRQLATLFGGKAQSMRLSTPQDIVRIENAGWHFSYIMNPERIIEKLGAFSHSEYDKSPYTDIDWIEKSRKSGLDLFGRDARYVFTDLSGLPESIRNNPDKYKEFIRDYARSVNNSVL
jgi:beta-1,4-mannosyl-glycoprotein beta-1,4-N-acetylglucosaminyltransferase